MHLGAVSEMHGRKVMPHVFLLKNNGKSWGSQDFSLFFRHLVFAWFLSHGDFTTVHLTKCPRAIMRGDAVTFFLINPVRFFKINKSSLIDQINQL